MNIKITTEEVEVASRGITDAKCDGCGASIAGTYGRNHTVLDCLQELQRQIKELRGDK